MAPLLSPLLFAATASAQVTTSFWMPYLGLGTENIGFVGSVMAANTSHTTIIVDYDAGTNQSALRLGGPPQTMTIGPAVFATSIDLYRSGEDDTVYHFLCDWPTPNQPDSNRTCTMTYSPGLASNILCESRYYPESTEQVVTRTHTYPARGSKPPGTETVRQTLSYGVGSGSQDLATTDVLPQCRQSGAFDDGFLSEVEVPASEVATYYLVITAGMDKLEATAAATPTLSSAMATGTEDADEATDASGSAAAPEVTEAGAPMATRAPLLAGLGAAVAALFV